MPSDRRLITAHHPSPIGYVPEGGRVLRHGYERIATPAYVALAADDEFGPDPREGMPELIADFYDRLHERDGKLYAPLHCRGADDAPGAFLAFLADPSPGPADFLSTHLLRSPVTAARWRPGRPWESHDPGGFDAGDGALRTREVRYRRREDAASAMRRFLEEDVLLTPTRVMVRRPILATYRPDHGESDALLWDRTLDFHPRSIPCVRPDRFRDVEAAYGAPHYATVDAASVRAIETRFPNRFLGDDDLAALAQMMPDVAVTLADAAIASSATDRGGARERIREARDALTPTAMLGRMGGIAPGSGSAAMRDALDLIGVVEGTVSCKPMYLGKHHHLIDNLVRYVRDFALPRLAPCAEPRPQADDEALEGLAP